MSNSKNYSEVFPPNEAPDCEQSKGRGTKVGYEDSVDPNCS